MICCCSHIQGPHNAGLAPYLFLHLVLVVTVPHFKWGLTFPNILALTLFASGKVNYKTTCTVQFLLHLVGFPSVSACEVSPSLRMGQGTLHLQHLKHLGLGSVGLGLLLCVTILFNFFGWL